MPTYSKLILFALIAAIGFATPLEAETVVFDDDFASDFEYSIFNFNRSDVPEPDDNPSDVSAADFNLLFGNVGNPDDALELTHFHDVSRDGGGAPESGDGVTYVQSFLINQSVPYNPSTQGAIQKVTFSIDYMAADNFDSIFFNVATGGSGNSSGFDSPITDGQWHTYTLTGVQSDFGSQDFSGAEDLRFGFGFTSSGVDVTAEPESRQVLVDNFSVTVSPIPEPHSVFVSAIAGLVMCCRRRRVC